jgi:iron complex transport system ATP-binding protein
VIDGIRVEADPEAVVVLAHRPLRVVSSAVAGGGLGRARAVVNLRVPKGFRCEEAPGVLARFVQRRGVPSPWVGLLTAAATEHAEVAAEATEGLAAMAVVTVGLGNRVSAGGSPVAPWRPSTINAVVVVDADPEPAALVNLVITATEAKVLALAEAGVTDGDGATASGTSTDALVVAATGRGPRCRFGGPATPLGWAVARAVRGAVGAGARRWMAARR